MSTESPGGSAEEPTPSFDPYRFGAPEHPIDPAYAPPGYRPPAGPNTGPSGPYSAPDPGAAFNPYAPPNQYAPPNPYAPPIQGGPPYGYPGAPVFNPYPPQTGGRNGMALTGLILGGLSVLGCIVSFVDLLLIIPAVIFSIIGLSTSKSKGTGKAMAITGLVLAIVGAIAATVISVAVVHHLHCTVMNDGAGNSSTHCSTNG